MKCSSKLRIFRAGIYQAECTNAAKCILISDDVAKAYCARHAMLNYSRGIKVVKPDNPDWERAVARVVFEELKACKLSR